MLDLKKGEKVIMKGFTGMKLGVFEVNAVNNKYVRILKTNGDALIFSRSTGKQVNTEEGKEKYANSIIPDDGTYVAPKRGKRKKTKNKEKKKTKTKAKKQEDYGFNDFEEDENFDAENLSDDDFVADESDELLDDEPEETPENAPIIDNDFEFADDEDDEDIPF